MLFCDAGCEWRALLLCIRWLVCGGAPFVYVRVRAGVVLPLQRGGSRLQVEMR